MALYPQLIQSAKSNGERVILERQRLRDMGEDENRVFRLFPYTGEELSAMDKSTLINGGNEL